MRILILEDEGLIALMLALEIESAGHQVIGPVATVAEALALAADAAPELALLDVNLGDGGCDGIDAAETLLERYGCRALFVSGEIDSSRARRANPWGLLRKPYDPRTLIASVRIIEAIRAGREPEHRLPRQLRLADRRDAAPAQFSVASAAPATI